MAEMALSVSTESARHQRPPSLSPLEQQIAEEKKEIHELHSVWEKDMKDYIPGKRHTRVIVLLLYWDKVSNSHFDLEDEVARLHNVFEGSFRYKVYKRSLNSSVPKYAGKDPTVLLQKYIAKVVCEIDGPNSLLIVYYAGHGNPGKNNELIMSGGNNHPGDEEDKVIWDEAERLVRNAKKSDVFLLFDCCYAGRVTGPQTRKAFSTRNFEYIAASDTTTRRPGKHSFTSALIHALQSLSEDPDGFTTLRLWETLRRAPHFPSDQTPVLGERGSYSSRRLILAPLPDSKAITEVSPAVESEDVKNNTNVKFGLCLQLSFGDMPTKPEMHNICKGLKDMVRNDELKATQINWIGMHRRGEYAAHQAAKYWHWRTKKASISHRQLSQVDRRPSGLTTPPPEAAEAVDLQEYMLTDSPLETRDVVAVHSMEEVGDVLVERLDEGDHLVSKQDYITAVDAVKWRTVWFLAGAGFVLCTTACLRRTLH